MNILGAYSITMALLLSALIGAALLLARYRDRLHAYFGTRPSASQAVVEVAPGARIMVVEIDGMTVICGLNKSGVTALQVVQPTPVGGAS